MNPLSLLPSLWSRGVVMLALAGSLFGYGYYKGWEHEHARLDAVQLQIQEARDKQALETAQKINNDKKVLGDVVQTFHTNLAAIDAYWRVRESSRPAAPTAVPPKTAAAGGTPKGLPDAVPAGRGTEEVDALKRQLDQLKHDAAITTQMFNSCRDGWISQESKQ